MKIITQKKMNSTKDLRLFIATFGFLILVLSCSKGGGEEASNTFSVSPTSITFDQDESKELNITTSGTWTIGITESWLTVSSFSGTGNSRVTVKVTSENNSQQTRNAQIAVTTSNSPEMYIVTVYQNPKKGTSQNILNINKNSISFNEKAGRETLQITSDTNWEIKTDASWCTVTPNNGNGNASITVSVSANNTGKSRTATITVSAKNGNAAPCTIDITQQGISDTDSKPGEGDNTPPSYSRNRN